VTSSSHFGFLDALDTSLNDSPGKRALPPAPIPMMSISPPPSTTPPAGASSATTAAPAQRSAQRDRQTVQDWAESTLEVLAANIGSRVNDVDKCQSANDLVPFVNLVKAFKPHLPSLNKFIMVSTSMPPPSDDKFVRARLIVLAGLKDVNSALEALLAWFARSPSDEQFFCGS